MWTVLRELIFPRSCIGCGRGGVLLCKICAAPGGRGSRLRLGRLEVVSCVPYEGLVRDAIAEFKRGRRAFAEDLAAPAFPLVDAGTTLVPIPTTRARRVERGFDQTRLLTRILRRRCGARVEELLVRRPGPAQHGRTREERLAFANRFRVRRGRNASGENLTLFDDVRTTGATLVDAARTLEDAGFEVAGALTIAWTPDPDAPKGAGTAALQVRALPWR